MHPQAQTFTKDRESLSSKGGDSLSHNGWMVGAQTISVEGLLPSQPSKEDFYRWSLIFRLQDLYEQEKVLIEQALERYPDWAYLGEREAWHKRPLFHPDPLQSQVVTRWKLDLPRNPDMIPSQEILEQLCLITAGGSNEPYRSMLFELLESIEATPYKDIPLFILNTTGISEEDQILLKQRFGNIQSIYDPGWDIDQNLVKDIYTYGRSQDMLKALVARPFLPRHFPGYRYYLWLDGDMWVQDPSHLDRLIQLAVRQGIGATPDVFHNFGSAYASSSRDFLLDEFKQPALLNQPSVNAGLFCVDARSHYFREWERLYRLHLEKGKLHFQTDQMAFNLALAATTDLSLAPFQHTQYLFDTWQPSPSFDGKVLYSPLGHTPIGVVHLTYPKHYNRFHRPFLKYTERENTDLAVEISRNTENLEYRKTFQKDGVIYGSASYRTFPWEHKAQIQKELEGLFLQELETLDSLALQPIPKPALSSFRFISRPSCQMQEDFYRASLLHRYHDEYEQEELLVQKALEQYPSWTYMQERQAWHKRPLFHPDPQQGKMVPRKPLYAEKDPNRIPKPETIAKLIFVTGGDANYFELMVEGIESFKVARGYEKVPIGILDSGLTEEQIRYLKDRWNAIIIPPGWYLPLDKFYTLWPEEKVHDIQDMDRYQTNLNHMFLSRFFPDFEYYIWMDADAWIQDDRAVDAFVQLAEQQGHAFHRASVAIRYTAQFKGPMLPAQYWDSIADREHVQFGFVCFNKTFADKIADLTETIVKPSREWWWTNDEKISMIIMSEYESSAILQNQEINAIYAHGLPFVKEDRDLLYEPVTLKPLTIYTMYVDKKRYFWYVQQVDASYDATNRIEDNRNFSFGPLKAINDVHPGYPNTVRRSLRYRVWPWEDKADLLQLAEQGLSPDKKDAELPPSPYKGRQRELYLASLYHRYHDAYAEEEALVQQALEAYPDWLYMRGREAWHKRPLFHPDVTQSKVVPRPALRAERDMACIPQPETVAKLCFITGGEANYLEPMLEMLESLRNGRWYHDIPIVVIEKGWSQEQKNVLTEKFSNLRFVTHKRFNDRDIPSNCHIIEAKLYFDYYLPEYEYYFWIDPDMWIHDDRALDQFMFHAEKQGFAIAHQDGTFRHGQDRAIALDESILARTYFDLMMEKDKPFCNSGIYCIHKNRMNRAREIYLTCVEEKGQSFYSEQIALNALVADQDLYVLPRRYNDAIQTYHTVCTKGNPHILYEKETGLPTGCIHNFGHFKWVPHYQGTSLYDEVAQKNLPVSLRFRVWPWEDKELLRNLLQIELGTEEITLDNIKKKTPPLTREYFALSQALQYQQAWEEEEELIQQALRDYPDWAYGQKRTDWHARPLFHPDPAQSKVVPRTIPRIDRGPSPFLNELCFVLAADQNFFDFLVEAIESIRATSAYGNASIGVLDCGLNEEQRSFLQTQLRAHIVPAQWDITFTGQEGYASLFKAMSARPFLPRYFPGYRYYFFLDVDAWIQDETAIDRYLTHAQQHGIALARDVMEHFADYGYHCKQEYIADEYWDPDRFATSPQVNAGVFCIDKESGVFEQWRTIFEAGVREKPFHPYMDQVSLNVWVAHHGYRHVLPEPYNYLVAGYGAPMARDDGLYTPHTGEKIGILHFTSHLKQSPLAYRFPVARHQLSSQDWEWHKGHFWHIHNGGKPSDGPRASLRFRWMRPGE